VASLPPSRAFASRRVPRVRSPRKPGCVRGPSRAQVAIRSTKAVGLEISGVDMMFRGDTPYVLEVNASPGFRELLEATGINAADAMVEYAVEKAKAGDPKRP
jgi:glutathione synthase/RimK-type ligase-like ATP-grasp enzyme